MYIYFYNKLSYSQNIALCCVFSSIFVGIIVNTGNNVQVENKEIDICQVYKLFVTFKVVLSAQVQNHLFYKKNRINLFVPSGVVDLVQDCPVRVSVFAFSRERNWFCVLVCFFIEVFYRTKGVYSSCTRKSHLNENSIMQDQIFFKPKFLFERFQNWKHRVNRCMRT